MSTSMIEPGTRFAGRYRLEERVSQNGGSTMWRATDETLARSVSMLTFSDDFPRTSEVVTAAGAASRLTDSRVVQVFDADDRAEHAYVVMEWVTGEYFHKLLSGGAPDPNRAAGLVAEAAEALTAAHAAGLSHLCLTPRSLLWNAGGTVKVVGIGLEAALAGISSDQPALADTQGLGRLLYAGLTGMWPGPEDVGLPTAPVAEGAQPVTPRQVRAGVPGNLDSVVCRALFPGARRGDPISTPAQMADALSTIPRHIPLPVSSLPSPPPRPPQQPATANRGGSHAAQHTASVGNAAGPTGNYPQRPTKRPPLIGKLIIGLVVAVVMVAIGVGGVMLGRNFGGSGTTTATPTPTNGQNQQPQAQALKPQTASGLKASLDGSLVSEKTDEVGQAIDGNPSTDWAGQHFNGADFGRLRKGTGIRLDMGKQVGVSSVKLNVGQMAQPGRIQVRVGNTTSPYDAAVAATSTNGVGTFDMKLPQEARGQYVYIWFTRLPMDGSQYKAHIYEVHVYGRG
jgi:hypothetical protein